MTHPYKSVPVRSSEITPKDVYLSRRDFTVTLHAQTFALVAGVPLGQLSGARGQGFGGWPLGREAGG